MALYAVTIDAQDSVNGVYRYNGGSSWTQIRGAVTSSGTFGGGWGLIVGGTGSETGIVLAYNGSPFDWFSIGERGATYAVSNDTVYKTTPDGSQVLQFDGFDGSTPLWSKVGDSAFLRGAGFGVVAQMPDSGGDTFLYTGDPNNWDRIGPKGGAYAIADTVYRSDPLGTKAFRYTGGASWDDLGGPPGGVAGLYAGGFGLFCTASDASGVYRYRGTPGNWERIGDPTGSCAVTDDAVYRVGVGGDMSVFRYNGSGTSWSSVGRPDRVLSLVVAGD